MNSIFRDFFILVALLGGVFLAIYGWVEFSPSEEEPAVEQEQSLISDKFKNKLADSFEEGREFLDNEHLRAYSVILNNRFTPKMKEPENFKSIKVINDGQVNAFTTIGDRVYLFKGLLDGVNDPNLVAAIVAHELGHVYHNHVEERLKVKLGTSLLTSIITGGNDGMITEVGRTVMSLSFSRSQEEEADEYARKLLEKSGLHPQRLAQAFLRMKSLAGSESPVEFLSTHPSLESRIEKSINYEVAEDFEEKTITFDWEKLIASIK